MKKLLANVRISRSYSGLTITPRDGRDTREVRRILEERAPAARVRRTDDGFSIDAPQLRHCFRLIDMDAFGWASDAVQFTQNRLSIEDQYPLTITALEQLQHGALGSYETLLSDLHNRELLDPHQLENVAAMTLPDGFGLCVFDEQGAGKTVTFVFAFDLLVERDLADCALIVAPLSMVSEWPRDIQRFTDKTYKTVVLSGSRLEKRKLLAESADIFVTNFETAIQMEEELRAHFRKRPNRSVMAVDESFFIKNPEAKRTQSLRRLREWCSRAYVLCGTPAPNSPMDIVEQLNFVDFGYSFRNVKLSQDKNIAASQISARLMEGAPYIRHLKRDVLPDLPGKTFSEVSISLQPIQRELYESLLTGLHEELQSVDDQSFRERYSTFMAKRSALFQVCSHPIAIDPTYKELPNKFVALDHLLNELIEKKSEKVIVWSFFTRTIDALYERYARFSPVRYDGTVRSTEERRSLVRRFQEDNGVMLFIGNPAAAGAGLTLHTARYAIYESMSNQAAHYLQSLDRIHRRGQNREVEYFVLLGEGTIEVSEYKRLQLKQQTAQDLLGDLPEPSMTRELMLREVMDSLREVQSRDGTAQAAHFAS